MASVEAEDVDLNVIKVRQLMLLRSERLDVHRLRQASESAPD